MLEVGAGDSRTYWPVVRLIGTWCGWNGTGTRSSFWGMVSELDETRATHESFVLRGCDWIWSRPSQHLLVMVATAATNYEAPNCPFATVLSSTNPVFPPKVIIDSFSVFWFLMRNKCGPQFSLFIWQTLYSNISSCGMVAIIWQGPFMISRTDQEQSALGQSLRVSYLNPDTITQLLMTSN